MLSILQLRLLMKCNCQQQSPFHNSLYDYGITENICNIRSKQSKKKVSFNCTACTNFVVDTIQNVLDREAICGECHIKSKNIKKEEERNQLKSKILEKIQQTDIIVAKSDLKTQLAVDMGISEHNCESLMAEIPDEEYLSRPFDVVAYLASIPIEKCTNCSRNLIKIKEKSSRMWKNMPYCDICWGDFQPKRDEMWEVILKNHTHCDICNMERQNSHHRFHFDHLNMFDKHESVCTMVSEGWDMEDILKETDRCQYICLPCHQIITDVERKLPFTKVKRGLSVKLNSGEISEEEYQHECVVWGGRYQVNMKEVYDLLRQCMLEAC